MPRCDTHFAGDIARNFGKMRRATTTRRRRSQRFWRRPRGNRRRGARRWGNKVPSFPKGPLPVLKHRARTCFRATVDLVFHSNRVVFRSGVVVCVKVMFIQSMFVCESRHASQVILRKDLVAFCAQQVGQESFRSIAALMMIPPYHRFTDPMPNTADPQAHLSGRGQLGNRTPS